jgi:tetratricopeptide (TPR) repeat protein
MDERLIQQLLADLKNPNETVGKHATNQLWRIWFEQKGLIGLEELRKAQMLFDTGDVVSAEMCLSDTIRRYPDFAEAWNQRAVIYYSTEQYRKSIADCQKVVELNRVHFGAWHGLGLNYMALREYESAIASFHRALQIQPHALINQKLILECTMQLQ